MKTIQEQCKRAYNAHLETGLLSTDTKNNILTRMSAILLEDTAYILSENEKDLRSGRENGISQGLLDRLALNSERLEAISNSFLEIRSLEDPIGSILDEWTLSNGLHIQKQRVPLGVIGMIYEARPNVTADTVALCLKTGNGIVLRGSSSAYHSNKAIVDSLQKVLIEHQINPDYIQLLENTSRESISEFVKMKDYLSLVIPRGGAELIQKVIELATVPTIETGAGICHVYIDKDADLEKAVRISDNAKTQRPSVCNACETMLIHEEIAPRLLEALVPILKEKGVELRGDEQACQLDVAFSPAQPSDWDTEYNDMILSIKIVGSLDEALTHIQQHGTQHTEAIVSENPSALETFLRNVDAAAVTANASTRFTDGGVFGFGAEIGISTQKLHARGPMGLSEITSYKYCITGNGQIRE